MSFTADLLDGLAADLADRGVGAWRPDGSAYGSEEVALLPRDVPAEPDRLVTLNAYPVTDDPRLPVSIVGVQVRTRARPDEDSDDLQDAVFNAWHGRTHLVLSTGVRVASLERRSGVHLGRDENDRPESTANYYATVQRPTAHRPQ